MYALNDMTKILDYNRIYYGLGSLDENIQRKTSKIKFFDKLKNHGAEMFRTSVLKKLGVTIQN